MRVKINVKDYGIDNLVFGKKYYMAYGGVTFGEEFLFTRKNRIELCEYQGHKKVSSYWVSKRYLKELLNSGAIHWISEID